MGEEQGKKTETSSSKVKKCLLLHLTLVSLRVERKSGTGGVFYMR